MPSVMDTYIENRARVQPNMTNNYDTVHGGVVMRLMDEVGAMTAMRFAGETCVTAGVSELEFRRPIPRGAIAVIDSWVYDHGRTSIQVRLRVDREDPRTRDRERTVDAHFTFVAVNVDGEPVPVPALTVETERGRTLQREAVESSR